MTDDGCLLSRLRVPTEKAIIPSSSTTALPSSSDNTPPSISFSKKWILLKGSRKNLWLYISLFVFVLTMSVSCCSACNEAVCASIVSKCTLLRSCDCEIEAGGCSCCKKCFACLEYLQADCCSCVGLCPTPNTTAGGVAAAQAAKSIVNDYIDAVPQLWDALVNDGDDLQQRWKTFTYPVDVLPSSIFLKKKKKEADDQDVNSSLLQDTVTLSRNDLVTVNCTVAYLTQCMAEPKCETSCQTMGALAYRWFTDGCCECVGHGCINYGINESRCEECSFQDEDDDLDLDNISDEELERLLQNEYEDITTTTTNNDDDDDE